MSYKLLLLVNFRQAKTLTLLHLIYLAGFLSVLCSAAITLIIFFQRSYRSPNLVKSRRLRWAGHVARIEEGRSTFKIVIIKPAGKRLLGRPSRRWEDNIRMNLKEIGIHTRNLVDSLQDRDYWRALVNAALNPQVP